MRKYSYLLLTAIALSAMPTLMAQEETPFIAYDVPAQNLLKFNRFLLNPTFSTVREDKSYVNLLHRNQSVSFDDNFQTYFLSYSGRVGDRSGVGLSLYTQREGLIDNFGLLANYAYGVKLSDKSNLTFGGNFSYYNSGLNQNRISALDPDDPRLIGSNSSALITFQPGFNISYGAFDFGAVADNLFDYNLKTSESLTDFGEKTFTGHLQYTHQFESGSGILENARLMPLARVRTDPVNDITLGGSLFLDLPKLGWLQAGYDDFYGASAGLGFNLNKRVSLGYTMEKGLSNAFENFGVTHEISLAYSFTPNLTEDRVMLEKENEDLVSADEQEVPIEELSLTEKDLRIAELEEKLAENNSILDELLFRQDSIERAQQQDLERRFATVMRLVRRQTGGENPEIEEKAKQIYFANLDTVDFAARQNPTPVANAEITNSRMTSAGMTNTTAAKKIIKLKDTKQPVVPNTTSTSKIARVAKDKINTTRKAKKSSSFKSFDIPDVESGHYLIANVYKGEKYTIKFIDDLEARGIEADYFTNPKNGMNYVYLKGFQEKSEAIQAYRTGLNGTYNGDTWIMKVNSSYGNDAYVSNSTTSQYDDDVLQKNVQNDPAQNTGVTYKTYNIDGLGSGFYIIANVFAKPENAKRFVRHLNDQGLNAGYFINPENNYRYVYLKKHDDWTNALVSYYSKLNDSYDDQIWIMRVRPNQTVA
ncbi:PorP/SprF family type IX secretion system membrane protein [uncultured Croceitalea sp.]|uniref:PorP/SprF family type IX secretion system membrane protein n=1 Tax=uncultured Croceitalea sp. TaxID=1798908 RepID=UPI00330648E0